MTDVVWLIIIVVVLPPLVWALRRIVVACHADLRREQARMLAEEWHEALHRCDRCGRQ